MANITIDTAVMEEFEDITSTDIQTYLTNVMNFLSTSYNRIVAFYSGQQSTVSQADFTSFTNLQTDTENMLAVFRLQGQALKNLKFWILLDQVEQIDSRLNSLANINKWSKSSITFVGYDPAQQAAYTLRAHQTLERVASDILSLPTPDDDWYSIAINNQLTEEDYTVDGGTTIQLSFPTINNGISINSVVAVMTGDAILGLDFQKKLQFADDDLIVLDGPDTVTQSMYILAKLKQNDNPDFPTLGLQSAVIVGGTRASLNFPVISRQITQVFASDDSFKNFAIQNLNVTQDQLNLSFQVSTRLNETQTGTIAIS